MPSRYYKFWRLTSHLLFCGLLMVAGFVARSYGAFHNDNQEAYTATLLLIYASPYGIFCTSVTCHFFFYSLCQGTVPLTVS